LLRYVKGEEWEYDSKNWFVDWLVGVGWWRGDVAMSLRPNLESECVTVAIATWRCPSKEKQLSYSTSHVKRSNTRPRSQLYTQP